MRRNNLQTLACLVLGLIITSANADPSFQGLGHWLPGGHSEARGISADGSTVVGWDRGNYNVAYVGLPRYPFVWTETSGRQILGDQPGEALGVSSDASFIVGYHGLHDFALQTHEAFRWLQGEGFEGLGATREDFGSEAHDVSATGAVVVGTSGNSGNAESMYWTSETGMVGIGGVSTAAGYLPQTSVAQAVSADGTVLAGHSSDGSGGGPGWVWTQYGHYLFGKFHYTVPLYTSVHGITPDGSYVVGTVWTGYSKPFKAQATGGYEILEPLPSGYNHGVATDISADGNVVVGFLYRQDGSDAFVWDFVNGSRLLKDILVDDCGLTAELAGWRLVSARAISDDGRKIVGGGTNPAGIPEAYIAEIQLPLCESSNDADDDGVPDDVDNCPDHANTDQADSDGDVIGDACDVCRLDGANDADEDGFCGDIDNCPTASNPDQANSDGQGLGDACLAGFDNDGDWWENQYDNCVDVANINQADGDGDALGDACDSCPEDEFNDAENDGFCANNDNCPDHANSDQLDTDGDGMGNACDTDDDDDGWLDEDDNCRLVANDNQADFDGDGEGDFCDMDVDGDNVVDADDACPLTEVNALVNSDGCAVAQLCPCDAAWRNHGKYVSCVAHTSEDFLAAGLITEVEKDTIVSTAGMSSCGAKK